MRISIIVLAMLVPMGGAFANWEVEDLTDEQGELFVAFAVDETDTIEIQMTCDELLDRELLLSVYTGVDADQKKALPEPVSVSFTVGAVPFGSFSGKVTEIEGEKVIDMSEADHAQIRDLAQAMAKGKTVTLSYADTVWTVPGTDSSSALPVIFEHCP